MSHPGNGDDAAANAAGDGRGTAPTVAQGGIGSLSALLASMPKEALAQALLQAVGTSGAPAAVSQQLVIDGRVAADSGHGGAGVGPGTASDGQPRHVGGTSGAPTPPTAPTAAASAAAAAAAPAGFKPRATPPLPPFAATAMAGGARPATSTSVPSVGVQRAPSSSSVLSTVGSSGEEPSPSGSPVASSHESGGHLMPFLKATSRAASGRSIAGQLPTMRERLNYCQASGRFDDFVASALDDGSVPLQQSLVGDPQHPGLLLFLHAGRRASHLLSPMDGGTDDTPRWVLWLRTVLHHLLCRTPASDKARETLRGAPLIMVMQALPTNPTRAKWLLDEVQRLARVVRPSDGGSDEPLVVLPTRYVNIIGGHASADLCCAMVCSHVGGGNHRQCGRLKSWAGCPVHDVPSNPAAPPPAGCGVGMRSASGASGGGAGAGTSALRQQQGDVNASAFVGLHSNRPLPLSYGPGTKRLVPVALRLTEIAVLTDQFYEQLDVRVGQSFPRFPGGGRASALHRHIEYTYVRCLEQGHVVFDPHHPTEPHWFVFHTGLSTPLQEPLYAYLVRRRPPTPQRDEHDDGDAAVREAGAPRFTGVVEWWKNGSGEIRCEELHSVVSKPAVYVHFSQLVMARRAAKELHEGMDVEFSVEPNPKRPGRMWATHVTLPGGDRIPGSAVKSYFGHTESILTGPELQTRGLSVFASDVHRATFHYPRDPCLLFDPTLHVSANIQHIVEDNWPRFSEACVLPPRMSVAVTKRTSAGGRELWLPPASTIAHCCRLVKTALAAARERAAGNNYLATPHYFYAQIPAIAAARTADARPQKVYQGSLQLLLPLFLHGPQSPPPLALTLRYQENNDGIAQYLCSTLLTPTMVWNNARLLSELPPGGWIHTAVTARSHTPRRVSSSRSPKRGRPEGVDGRPAVLPSDGQESSSSSGHAGGGGGGSAAPHVSPGRGSVPHAFVGDGPGFKDKPRSGGGGRADGFKVEHEGGGGKWAASTQGSMLWGHVTSWHRTHGWIANATTSVPIFVHHSDVEAGPLVEGARVQYIQGHNAAKNKPKAVCVRRVQSPGSHDNSGSGGGGTVVITSDSEQHAPASSVLWLRGTITQRKSDGWVVQTDKAHPPWPLSFFAHRRDISDGASVDVGSTVRFVPDLHERPDGVELCVATHVEIASARRGRGRGRRKIRNGTS